MSIADDLQKLEQLKSSGSLSEDEFQQAKRRLLFPSPQERDSMPDPNAETLGKAANRYVSFNIGMTKFGIVVWIIGLIIFLLIFFNVFVPMFHNMPSFL